MNLNDYLVEMDNKTRALQLSVRAARSAGLERGIDSPP